MTAIGGLKFQVEQTHLQSLNRARQALDKATVEPPIAFNLNVGMLDKLPFVIVTVLLFANQRFLFITIIYLFVLNKDELVVRGLVFPFP
jgi:hypothetical protein